VDKCTGQAVGVDISDRSCEIALLDAEGNELETAKVATTQEAILRYFRKLEPSRVAMEVGTHSAWMSRIIEELGHEVYVANARKLRAIWDSDFKCDRTDARLLAEIVLFRPALLRPIKHRGEEARLDLMLVRTRSAMVKVRTSLINHVRGTVKAFGGRMPSSDAVLFHKREDEIPALLRDLLEPVMKLLKETTAWIRGYEERIAKHLESDPEASRLLQVPNIGPITVLAYMNTIEDPNRFPKANKVASYLGLVPRRDQSGEQDRQLRITKAGDRDLRTLLVQCAQRTLSNRSGDSDLKRWGLALAARGGKNAKKRAVVAVARKLALLLLRLWRTGHKYEAFRSKAGAGVTTDAPQAPAKIQVNVGTRARVMRPRVRANKKDAVSA